MALAAYTILVLLAGRPDHFHFCDLIRIGPTVKESAIAPCNAYRRPTGFDGEFYFVIAHDPFLTRPDTAASLDDFSLRYRRILYPLTAWAVSLGKPVAIPYALVALNVLAAGLLIGLLARAAGRAGRSPWLALVVAGYPGTWFPVARDLVEPLQLLFLAAGFLAGSSVLLLMAALTKETAAVALVSEFVRAVLVRDLGRALRFAAATAAMLAWTFAVLLLVRGGPSGSLFGAFLRPPGAPIIVLTQTLLFDRLRFVVLLAALPICVIAAIRPLLGLRDGPSWAAALYGVIELGASGNSWHDPVDVYRQVSGAVVLVFLSWVSARDRWGTVLLVMGALVGALSFALLLIGRLPR